MAARPAKRQRRLTVLSDDDEAPAQDRIDEQLPTRTKARVPLSRTASWSSSTSPGKKRKDKSTSQDGSGATKSLHSFFHAATDEQRWSAVKNPEKENVQEEGSEEFDLIEDDSYDEIFDSLNNSQSIRVKSTPQTRSTQRSRPSRRFILPESPKARSQQQKPDAEPDSRPWAERFAPTDLSELAVHKKKVSDVRNWLTEALSGRSRRKLLILYGPAGSGKTTTVTLLAQSMGFEIVTWKSPSAAERAGLDSSSFSAQFDEFINRSSAFGALDLDGSEQSGPGQAAQRVILVEEFPSTLTRGSSALDAFRASLRRYLASAAGSTAPPVVLIISETLLGTSSSLENFTMHRLLGPEIYLHPGATTLEFNRIAPTYMYKALDLVLRKESRQSKRTKIPSPAVLKHLSELGDIRSAISSLEFLCLRGDDSGDWGGLIAAKTRRPRSKDPETLTAMEKESLEMITQREASLGLFHAVGKVVYNKRDDPNTTGLAGETPPPAHLSHHARPRVSQVLVDDLVNETATDAQTFAAALHENYVPSCNGASFTDCVENCIDYLSASDLLGTESRSALSSSRTGVGLARNRSYYHPANSSSVDTLRQDEISFHVAVRGLLFSLPDPVRRSMGSTSSLSSRSSDAFKMFFPTSVRLWRETEELSALIDMWQRRLLDQPLLTLKSRPAQPTEPTGVAGWKSLGVNNPLQQRDRDAVQQQQSAIPTLVSRDEVILHQLPYLSRIADRRSETRRDLDRIVQFHGIGRPSDEIPDDDELDAAAHPRSLDKPAVEEAVEKLMLEDDPIED